MRNCAVPIGATLCKPSFYRTATHGGRRKKQPVSFLLPGLRRPLIVADPQPLTLSQMLAAMRRGLGRRPGLIPMPAPLLRLALDAAGYPDSWQFVTGSLVADPAALMGLGWAPKVTTDQGLEQLMRSTPQIA